MRIAFISVVNHSKASPGIVDLANKLSVRGCDVTVFSIPESRDAAWEDAILFRPLDDCGSNKILRYSRWAAQIYTAARPQWDVLIGVNEPGAVLAYILGKCGCAGTRLPWVRELAEIAASGRWRRFLLRQVYRDAPWIDVCQERAEYRAEMLGVHNRPVLILNVPPRTTAGRVRRYDPESEERFRLVYTGAVLPRVLLEHVLDGMALARTTVSLRIVGPYDSGYRDSLERRALHHGISPSVEFTGPVARGRLDDECAGAHAGIVFYGNDGGTIMNERLCAPNKFFEYLSRGLPVLCSNNPTLVRWIAASQAGICVDPRDPAAVAKGIDELAADLPHYSTNAIARHRDDWNLESQLDRAFALLEKNNPVLGRMAALLREAPGASGREYVSGCDRSGGAPPYYLERR